jgi:hypothetical protein
MFHEVLVMRAEMHDGSRVTSESGSGGVDLYSTIGLCNNSPPTLSSRRNVSIYIYIYRNARRSARGPFGQHSAGLAATTMKVKTV